MKLLLFVIISIVSLNLIGMEKEGEPKTITTYENPLETRVHLLMTMQKNLENINTKLETLVIRVTALTTQLTLINTEVTCLFEYAQKSDPGFIKYLDEKVQARTRELTEEEQIQLAIKRSLQQQFPTEEREEKKQ